MSRGKPRIALVVDTQGWAFWNVARQLQRHLSDSFDFDIIGARELGDDLVRILVLTEDADIVHFFWREHYFLFDAPYTRSRIESLGLTHDEFSRRFIAGRVFSTSIQDHLFLDAAQATERRFIFTDRTKAYYVGSQKLRAAYDALKGYPPPLAVLPDGVDTQLFKPENLARLSETNRPFVVGWSGNSRWVEEIDDFKGVRSILLPSIAALKDAGANIEACFADRNVRMIPHDEMPAYYSQLDVYVCTSKCEGTPNPVLEAMASGLPVISTDVGVVPEVFGPEQQAFIVERSVSAVSHALKKLIASPALRQKLSAENLEQIAAWDWSIRARDFRGYFDSLLRTF